MIGSQSSRTVVVAAAVAVPLILLALAILIGQGFDENDKLRRNVELSHQHRAALQRVLSLHQDLELGQRGYLLTGDPQFLEPYYSASRDVDQAMAALEDRYFDQDNGQSYAALRRDSDAKRDFVDRIIRLQRAGNIQEALRVVRSGEGKRLMDRLRVEVARLSRLEQEQLVRRTNAADAARMQLRSRTVLLQTTLLLLLALAAWLAARSNAARQRALREARDLASRQESIFDSAKDGMIVINPSGSIESLNPSAAKMFGQDAADLLRRDIGVLFEIAPDRGRVESFLRRLGANRRETYGQVQEFVGRRPDGSSFPVEVSISPVRLVESTLFLAVIRDISERREIEQMKTEFVATVSHELRTPLTSIAGSLGLISGGAAGELSSKAARLVEIAYSNALRLVRLINDILDIEKIEAGRMQFDIRPIALDQLLPKTVQQSAGFASQFEVQVDTIPPPAGAAVLADEDRLMQVLTNLLSNAIKFSKPGGVVSLSVTSLDRRYRISVADRGSGIPDSFRERIFSKFAQADGSDTRQKGGTGLGLSIVREIVLRLGGSVSFESAEGEGTVFHVDLPATASPQTLASAPLPQPEPIAAASLPIILHVDDDPDMLDVLANAFEGKARLRSTPSVVAARRIVRNEDIDAAILDIGLIDGCGTELVPLLRQRRPELPILVFTAQEAELCQTDGVDVVLVKSRAGLDDLVAETMRRIVRTEEGPQ
ncbi:ATP-binding protein [Sphingobium ummariense]